MPDKNQSRNTFLILLPLLFFLVAAGCYNGDSGRSMGYGGSGDMAPVMDTYSDPAESSFEDVMEMPATKQPASSSSATQTDAEQAVQKFIKTGGISFQSKSVAEDYEKLQKLLPKYEAYIEKENQSKTLSRITYEVTVRVPAQTYDTLYSNLSGMAYQLENRYSNIEDVTERYYDLKSRIKNKKALEQRYIDLLKQARAMKDVLEIEKSLNEVRTDIERLQGQFNFLSKQVQLSTINLTFYELIPYSGATSGRRTFLDRITAALGNGWDGFQSFLVGMVTLWPFILLLIGGIYLFRTIRKRWKKKK